MLDTLSHQTLGSSGQLAARINRARLTLPLCHVYSLRSDSELVKSYRIMRDLNAPPLPEQPQPWSFKQKLERDKLENLWSSGQF